jgi:signal transduction histidine kinase
MLGLEAALAHLGEQMGDQHGFRFHCTADPEPIPLSDAPRIMLYRAARELLVNIVKHAHARHVWMAVHRVGTHLHITVHDDGVGFDSAASGIGFTPTGGFGLFSIRQQLDAVGGTLEIDAGLGTGSRIRIAVPLACRNHI